MVEEKFLVGIPRLCRNIIVQYQGQNYDLTQKTEEAFDLSWVDRCSTVYLADKFREVPGEIAFWGTLRSALATVIRQNGSFDQVNVIVDGRKGGSDSFAEALQAVEAIYEAMIQRGNVIKLALQRKVEGDNG